MYVPHAENVFTRRSKWTQGLRSGGRGALSGGLQVEPEAVEAIRKKLRVPEAEFRKTLEEMSAPGAGAGRNTPRVHVAVCPAFYLALSKLNTPAGWKETPGIYWNSTS